MSIGVATFQVMPEAKGIQNQIEQAISGGSQGYGKSLSGALGTAAKVGAAALAGATTAIGAFGAASVKTGAAFDSSMSQVAATMGKTMDDMGKEVGSTTLTLNGQVQQFSGNLREFAQVMGQNTAFSATQAADALNYMALAGYDTQQSMDMLPNVLNLAAAGNMDLARASDMVTDTQTAFGMTAERTTQMVDEMAKAASTGNTSVEQLGDAFLTVGGLAQELNGGMVTLKDGTTANVDGVQELEIALTAMANAGVKGSEAGTHMRNMLLKLSSPTSDGTKQLEALGVSVFDTEGKMRSLSNIFGDLNGALGNLTQEQKIQAISDLFNTRDLASAEALLNAVGDDWNSIGESILNADGAAQKMADTQLDNLAGDVTLFKSALEGAQIAISDTLVPSLREFVQFGTEGLSRITTAFQQGGLSGAMTEFGSILSEGINMIISEVPQMLNAGMQLIGALGQGLLQNLPMIISAANQIIQMLLQGIMTALPSLVDGACQIVTGLATGIAQMLPTLIPAAVQMLTQIVQTLAENAPMMLDAATQLVTGLVDGLSQGLNEAPALLNAGLQLVQGLADGILQAIPTLIAALPQLITAIVTFCSSATPQMMQAAVQLFQGIVQALPQIITALTAALPQIIDGIVNGLIAGMPMIIQGYVQLFGAIVMAIPQIMAACMAAIPQIISGIAQGLQSGISTIASSIGAKASEFVTQVQAIGTQVMAAVGTFISQLPGQLVYGAGLAIGQFIAAMMQLPTRLSTIWSSVVSSVTSFATQFVQQATMMARNFFNALVNGIQTLPARLRSLGQQLVGALKDLPSKFLQIGSDIVKGIWNGISGGWSWLTSQVKGLADKLLQGVKDGLKIGSPSKVFADEVGKWIPAGIALGIQQNTGVLNRAVDSMMDSMLSTKMSVPAFATAGGYGNESIVTGGYYQTINLYSPEPLTPSEVARQTRNATRSFTLSQRITR